MKCIKEVENVTELNGLDCHYPWKYEEELKSCYETSKSNTDPAVIPFYPDICICKNDNCNGPLPETQCFGCKGNDTGCLSPTTPTNQAQKVFCDENDYCFKTGRQEVHMERGCYDQVLVDCMMKNSDLVEYYPGFNCSDPRRKLMEVEKCFNDAKAYYPSFQSMEFPFNLTQPPVCICQDRNDTNATNLETVCNEPLPEESKLT